MPAPTNWEKKTVALAMSSFSAMAAQSDSKPVAGWDSRRNCATDASADEMPAAASSNCVQGVVSILAGERGWRGGDGEDGAFLNHDRRKTQMQESRRAKHKQWGTNAHLYCGNYGTAPIPSMSMSMSISMAMVIQAGKRARAT